MTLRDAVAQLQLLPDEHTIYATRVNGQWLAGSTAFVREPPEDDRIEQVFDGTETEYLLEVWLAKRWRRCIESITRGQHLPWRRR